MEAAYIMLAVIILLYGLVIGASSLFHNMKILLKVEEVNELHHLPGIGMFTYFINISVFFYFLLQFVIIPVFQDSYSGKYANLVNTLVILGCILLIFGGPIFLGWLMGKTILGYFTYRARDVLLDEVQDLGYKENISSFLVGETFIAGLGIASLLGIGIIWSIFFIFRQIVIPGTIWLFTP